MEGGAPPPNIIFILVDDLGWNDVGYHGSEIKTPRIDRLVSEGIQLNRCYSTPICSPTRAGILTGRYPIRFGLQRNVIRPWDRAGFPSSETTTPEILAEYGYKQRAIIGKWHLGFASSDFHPLNHGFSSFYGQYSGGVDYFTREVLGENDWHRDYETCREDGYTTNLVTEEVVRFLESYTDDEPFYLYLPFNAPHIPLQAPQEYLARYPELKGTRKIYAAMVSCLDDGVGRIMDTLDKLDLAQNTIVVFLSDNGGHHKAAAGSNSPLRGGKGSLFEGGIRVPAAIRWAGRLEPGRSLETPMAYIDWLPTLLGLAGLEPPPGLELDGVNMAPLFQGEGESPEREIYSYFVGLGGREGIAVHSGEWKLISYDPIEGREGRLPAERYLFRILDDPEESRNLLDQHRDVAEELLARGREFAALRPEGGVGLEGKPPAEWKPPLEWRLP